MENRSHTGYNNGRRERRKAFAYTRRGPRMRIATKKELKE